MDLLRTVLKNTSFYSLLLATYMPIPPTSPASSSPKFARATTSHVTDSVLRTSALGDDTSSIAGSELSEKYVSCEELDLESESESEFETTLADEKLEAAERELENDFRKNMASIFSGRMGLPQDDNIESTSNEITNKAANLIVDFLYDENKPLPTYIFDYLPDSTIKELCEEISNWARNFCTESVRSNLKDYVLSWDNLTGQKEKLSKCIESTKISYIHSEKRLVELYKFIYNYRCLENMQSHVEEAAKDFKHACDIFLTPHPLKSESEKNERTDFLESLKQYKSTLTTLWMESAEIYFNSCKSDASPADKIIEEEKYFFETAGCAKITFSKIHNQLKNIPNNAFSLQWPVSLYNQFVYGEMHRIIFVSEFEGIAKNILKATLPEEDQHIIARLGLSTPVVEQQAVSAESSLPDVTPSLFFRALQAIQQLFKTLYDYSLGAFITYVGTFIAYVKYLLSSSKKADLSTEANSFDLALENIAIETDETVRSGVSELYTAVVEQDLSIPLQDAGKSDYQIVNGKLSDKILDKLQYKLNEDNILDNMVIKGEYKKPLTTLALLTPYAKKLQIHKNIQVSTEWIDFDNKSSTHTIYFDESDRRKPGDDANKEILSKKPKYILDGKLVDFCSHYDSFMKNQDELLLISDLLATSSSIDKFLTDAEEFSSFKSEIIKGQKSYDYFLSRENDDVKLIISFENNEKNESLPLEEGSEENQFDNSMRWKVALKINVNDNKQQYITILREDSTYYCKSKKMVVEMNPSNPEGGGDLTMLPEQRSSSITLTEVDDPQEQPAINTFIHTIPPLERLGRRRFGQSSSTLNSDSAVSRSRSTSPNYEQLA